jgi:DNA-binding transcriptional LysR family regulator
LEDPKTVAQVARHRLRLGCFADLAPAWLAPTIKMLRVALPELDVVPVVADFETMAAEIASGSLDLAITYDLGLDASFERRALARVRPFAFMAADDDLATLSTVSLKGLADKALILFEEGLSIRHMLGLFAAQGLRPVVAHRVASLEVMRSFAANGEGIGIAYSAPTGATSYDGAAVVRVPISDKDAVEDIVAAYRPDMAEVAPIEAVIALFKQGR